MPFRDTSVVHPLYPCVGEPIPMRKPPTGEPCAGEPHARFGGRGRQEPFPTPIEWNRRCLLLDGEGSRRASGNDYIDLLGNQLADEGGKAIILSLGPSILDQDVFALDVAEVMQALAERLDEIFLERSCGVPEESYPGDLPRLLRPSCNSKSKQHHCNQDRWHPSPLHFAPRVERYVSRG